MSEQSVVADSVSMVLEQWYPKKLKKRITPKNWDKWSLRSGLQKAIRRGMQAEALDYGVALCKIDEAYTWYSLMTIAVEDVLDLDALIFTASMYGSKTQRNKILGGEDPTYLVVTAIRSMLDKVKTRIACEISLPLDLTMKYKADSFCRMNTDRLKELALNLDDVSNHYVAMTVLGGKARTADGGYVSRSLPDVYEVIDALPNLDEKEREASKLAARYAVDSMCMAVPYALMMKNTADYNHHALNEFPSSIKIGGIIEPAFDMHTQVGKTALKATYTSINKKSGALDFVKPGSAIKALGAAVFILEGGLIDKQLHSEELDEWQDTQNREFLIGYGGITIEEGMELLAIMKDNLPLLRQKREWAYEQ